MGKINVLPFEVANLIAAGEVVERPASVVKELLENAIDAGATRIKIVIQNGGVTRMSVTDDGCGMTAEDMPVALRRHATSKIHEKDDLASIMTLGFRGEALAAISSVSDVTIVSKIRDAASGTVLTAVNGRVTDLSEIGCADGTTVTVENLFGNVPARRKFLKKDATESQAIAAIVEKVAMSHPEIAFTLLCDGTPKITTYGDGDIKRVLYALYGADFAKKLLTVSGESNGIRVSGFVGRSDNARNNRNYQNTFLNGRFVKSKTIMAALEQAFTSYMAPERFPVSALYIELDAGAVDVNVHPSKLEVKFSDEHAVFETVYYAVKNALENAVYRPELTVTSQTKAKKGEELLHRFQKPEGNVTRDQIRISTEMPIKAAPPMLRPQTASHVPASEAKPYTPPVATPKESIRLLDNLKKVEDGMGAPLTVQSAERNAELPPIERRTLPPVLPETEIPKEMSKEIPKEETRGTAGEPEIPRYSYIGEAFNTYLLAETDDGLLLIDKHAAHERILFEMLKKEAENDGRIASQGLMLSISAILSAEEAAAAASEKAALEEVGFSYNVNGNAAEIVALPAAVDVGDAADLFIEMCDDLASGTGDPEKTAAIRKEISLHRVACKAAIKGGRHYDESVHRWLVEKLLTMPEITVCPHGRPVAVKLTKNELDRFFDRIK